MTLLPLLSLICYLDDQPKCYFQVWQTFQKISLLHLWILQYNRTYVKQIEMISFKTAVAMVGQTKISICLVGIVVILAIFTKQANANVKKLKKDVKKLQKKDKEIISQLEDLDNNYDTVTQIVDHIITEGEMVKTLIGELEKKDQELELTMQDIQNKGG